MINIFKKKQEDYNNQNIKTIINNEFNLYKLINDKLNAQKTDEKIKILNEKLLAISKIFFYVKIITFQLGINELSADKSNIEKNTKDKLNNLHTYITPLFNKQFKLEDKAEVQFDNIFDKLNTIDYPSQGIDVLDKYSSNPKPK